MTVLGKKVRNNNNLRCAPVELTESLMQRWKNSNSTTKKRQDIMDVVIWVLIEGDSIMLGVSSEYVYSLGYMRESDVISGGYMSGVGGANMGIGGYIDANYSIVAGRNNMKVQLIVLLAAFQMKFTKEQIMHLYGTEIICPSGNSSAAMFGKYNEIDNPEIDFEGGEQCFFRLVMELVLSRIYRLVLGLVMEFHLFLVIVMELTKAVDVSRSDVFYVTNKSVV